MTAPRFAPWMKVFPIARNEKTPPEGFTDWQHRASNDPVQIAAWAAQFVGCNWAMACGPSGVGVVDVDGEVGEDSLFAYELEHGALPVTMEQKSPKGRHLIFRDPDGALAPTVGKLGAKLDTRGGASYILIAPSAINGVPYVFNNQTLADLPAHVRENASKAREAISAPDDVTLDTPTAVARVTRLLKDYVARGHVAVEGKGGDDRTYAVAAEVLSLGLSEDKAFELIHQHWNAACLPPWPEDELRVKIENASRYAQNDAGAWAVSPFSERLSREALDRLAETAGDQPSSSLGEERTSSSGWAFGVHDPVADASLPPVTYRDARKLWPDSPGKTVSQVIAGPKQHKTNFIMAELFRLMRDGAAKVLMLALEGGYGVRTMRLPVLAKHHGVALADLDGRFQVARISGGMFDMSDPECVVALADYVRAGGWTDVFIDTQHRSAGALDENSATDARLFWNAVELLRLRGRCNVVLAHHTGKDASKGGRGSSADLASVDQQIELTFDRLTLTVTAKVTARKDGVDGFSVPFRVEQAREGVPPVIVPMTAEEAQAVAEADDLTAPRVVAAALQSLKAIGIPKQCSTQVLALEILTLNGELRQSDDEQKRALKNLVNRLQARVTKDRRLQALGRKDGAGRTAPWLWSLPAEGAEAWPNA